MDDVRIGVIGLNFGTHHVRTLVNLEGARLQAVADSNQSLADGHAARYRVPGYHDGVEMILREKPDGVVIAVPPAHREPLLKAAARKGVAVFVEKPWALNGTHADELATLCRDMKARVMTGFSFRYLPAITGLRKLIASELGPPLAVTGTYVSDWVPPPEHWLWDSRTGGGYFNENSCHLFDSLNSILGTPRSLQAQTRSCFGRPSADIAMVTIVYRNGALASVAVGGIGTGAFDDYPRLDIIMINGQARLGGHHHIWDSLAWAHRTDTSVRTLHCPPERLGATRYSEALREFVTCIRDNKPFPSGIDDGVLCVRMAEAVVESAMRGHAVALTS